MRLGFGLATMLVLVTACGDGGTRTGASGDRNGGTAVYCASSLPDGLNAFTTLEAAAGDARLLLFTPLVLFDSAGAPKPHLASAWQWSEDRTNLTFTLRNDVKWHDGQPVTAEDVAWTLRSAADTLYAYPGQGDFETLSNVEVTDPTRVTLTFRSPYVPELEPFAALPILPRHLLKDVPPAEFARAEYQRAPVGSGPFRFAGRTQDGSIQLDRVADYPEALGRPMLDRIVLRAIPEPSVLLTEMQTGGVDACTMGSSRARSVEAAGARVALIPPLGVQVVPLDMRKPPLDDARVRRALSAALDRAEIAAALSTAAKPARTFLSADMQQWIDPSLLQPDDDSARAAAVLDSAGWNTIGQDGIRRNARGQALRIALVAPQTLTAPLTVVEAQWRRVGIGTDLRFVEPAAYVSIIRNEKTRPNAMALAFIPDRVLRPDPRSQLHSEGASNLSSYKNAEVDSLVDRLSAVLPDDQRAQIYHALQRRVAEDVPSIYLLNTSRILALGSRLQDVRVDRNGPFSSAASWWIPADRRRGGGATATTADSR